MLALRHFRLQFGISERPLEKTSILLFFRRALAHLGAGKALLQLVQLRREGRIGFAHLEIGLAQWRIARAAGGALYALGKTGENRKTGDRPRFPFP